MDNLTIKGVQSRPTGKLHPQYGGACNSQAIDLQANLETEACQPAIAVNASIGEKYSPLMRGGAV